MVPFYFGEFEWGLVALVVLVGSAFWVWALGFYALSTDTDPSQESNGDTHQGGSIETQRNPGHSMTGYVIQDLAYMDKTAGALLLAMGAETPQKWLSARNTSEHHHELDFRKWDSLLRRARILNPDPNLPAADFVRLLFPQQRADH